MAKCQRQLLQGFADWRNGKSMFKTLFVLLCHVPSFFQNALEHACGLMVCHDVVDQIVSSKLTEGTFEFTPVVEELFQMPLGKKNVRHQKQNHSRTYTTSISPEGNKEVLQITFLLFGYSPWCAARAEKPFDSVNRRRAVFFAIVLVLLLLVLGAR